MVHVSHAHKNMDMARERISLMVVMFLSFQMTFSFVTSAVVWAILDSTSGLDPSSDTIAPRYLKLRTVSSFLSKVMSVLIVTNDISFHARVGRFSPFLYLRSVAIAVILFWLQLVVLVSPCFLGSRISRDYRFPPAPLFLCSERKPSSLTTGSSKTSVRR